MLWIAIIYVLPLIIIGVLSNIIVDSFDWDGESKFFLLIAVITAFFSIYLVYISIINHDIFADKNTLQVLVLGLSSGIIVFMVHLDFSDFLNLSETSKIPKGLWILLRAFLNAVIYYIICYVFITLKYRFEGNSVFVYFDFSNLPELERELFNRIITIGFGISFMKRTFTSATIYSFTLAFYHNQDYSIILLKDFLLDGVGEISVMLQWILSIIFTINSLLFIYCDSSVNIEEINGTF
jgi:hypothetical protein